MENMEALRRAAADRRVRDPDRLLASTWMDRRSISRWPSMFVAQAAGIQMSIGQQFLMLLTLMLTSKGVAGVPRAALVILLGTSAASTCPPNRCSSFSGSTR